MQTIPSPTVYPWEDRDGQPVRCFRGGGAVVETATGEVDLHVEGIEHRNGDVVRVAVINGVELTAGQLRAHMATCADVLTEVER